MSKKIVIAAYIFLIISMAAATIIEKFQGTESAINHVYGSWWFAMLWAIGVAAGIFYFLKRKVKRVSVIALHLSFVLMLAGALLTKLTSSRGMIHLREGEPTSTYVIMKGTDIAEANLPFTIKLDTFLIKYHEGTNAPADYTSKFTITDGQKTHNGAVSMNKIYSLHGTRLYQSSFDNDGKGSILSINRDVWGIPFTYAGYALLFISLVWILVDPNGRYREILRQQNKLRQFCLLAIGMMSMQVASAAKVLPEETANKMGKLYVVYNDRVCPLQTLAIDFTKKIYGRRHYKEYTAEQFFTGFLFYPNEWTNEEVIKVKGDALRETLSLPKYCALTTFFDSQQGTYKLGPLLNEYQQGASDKLHQQVATIDDKLMLIIMELQQGRLLKIFPFEDNGRITWYAPTEQLPSTMEEERKAYFRNSYSLLFQDAADGNYERMNQALDKILLYQQTYGAPSIPSATKTKAERIYNKVPITTILFMVNLTLGFLTLFFFLYLSSTKEESNNRKRMHRVLFTASLLLVVSFLALTFCLILRGIISGSIPMTNGYETMILMAWLVMLLSLVAARRAPIALTFGFLLSGFFLLVSHLSQMDPNVSHVMPVLASPLLTIHVSIIMTAYALLSLTFICGISAVITQVLLASKPEKRNQLTTNYQLLSLTFLYPALTCLGFGIFIGAIWANISWGTYWSWDPKETWALITFMVYGVAVHDRSLSWLRRPMAYHCYIILAFLTLLMTYFGVNYFLGGMHSYA